MQDASLTIVAKNSSTDPESSYVLLVKRKDVPVWVLPGGGIDSSETPEHAAIRETKEETGLTVEIVHHVATYHPMNSLAAPIHLFLCKQVGLSEPLVTKENDEVVAAEFFPIHNLPSAIFPVHKSFLMEWLKTTKFPILRPLTEVTYFSVLKLALAHPVLVSKYLLALIKRILSEHA